MPRELEIEGGRTKITDTKITVTGPATVKVMEVTPIIVNVDEEYELDITPIQPAGEPWSDGTRFDDGTGFVEK